MQTRTKFLTLIAMIALLVGIVACAAPATTPTATPTPVAETGGTDDAEPSGETAPVDDSNGLGMTDLIGNWQATEIKGNPVAGAVIPTLSFIESGEVAGNGGCNGYGGMYTVDANALTIAGVVSTMMACEDQTLTTQESTFLSALQTTATYSLDGNTLTLLDNDGNAIVVLSRI
jgi:heat shock protein HslJ